MCQILKISGATFYRSIKTGVSDAANRMAVDTLRMLPYSSAQSRGSHVQGNQLDLANLRLNHSHFLEPRVLLQKEGTH
jgi:hypothetical protein